MLTSLLLLFSLTLSLSLFHSTISTNSQSIQCIAVDMYVYIEGKYCMQLMQMLLYRINIMLWHSLIFMFGFVFVLTITIYWLFATVCVCVCIIKNQTKRNVSWTNCLVVYTFVHFLNTIFLSKIDVIHFMLLVHMEKFISIKIFNN